MADIKISDATRIEALEPTDMLPIAREGSAAPYHATMAEFAAFVTQLASSDPPQMSAVDAEPGTMEQYARADHRHPSDGTRAPLDSPPLTGNPTTPTPQLHDASLSIANTEFVMREIASEVETVIDSPTFVGTPRAPTPGIDDNTDLIATTEYVQNQGATEQPQMNGATLPGASRRWARSDHVHPHDDTRAALTDIPLAATTVPTMDSVATPGVGTTWARADHVHSSDTSRYPVTNPAGYQTAAQISVTLQSFAYRDSPVLIGIPTAPTPPPTDSSPALATTAFVRTGTRIADTPPTGQIGEYLFAQVLQSAPVPIANNQIVNITQITLSAGDWGVSGNVGFAFTAGGATMLSCGINTVSAQIPTGGTPINMIQLSGNVTIPATNMPIPATRIVLAAPAIIYLVATGTFTGTGVVYGTMNARRVR
jgi:hypothetical protein